MLLYTEVRMLFVQTCLEKRPEGERVPSSFDLLCALKEDEEQEMGNRHDGLQILDTKD